MAIIQTEIKYLTNKPGSVKILFSVTNTSDNSVVIKKRDTPLEGLKTNCFDVRRNGRKVPYDGYFLKRGTLQSQDYFELTKGGTYSVEIDLSDAYDFSKPGKYEVHFDANRLEVVVQPEGASLSSTDAAGTERIAVQDAKIAIHKKEEPVKLPIGARNRVTQKKKEGEEASLAAFSLKKPVVNTRSEKKKKQVEDAHHTGYKYAQKAEKVVDDNDGYRRWFGKHTVLRAKRVKKSFGEINNAMVSQVFNYEIGGPECDGNTYAYTTVGGTTIWLCALFWSAPDEGHDSKAGTIVHEHSHASAGTDDFEYLEGNCEKLAKKKPARAIRNADNYEFFAEFTIEPNT